MAEIVVSTFLGPDGIRTTEEKAVVRIETAVGPGGVVKRSIFIRKGDFEGHPFRGNQWTEGQGGGEEGSKDDSVQYDDPHAPNFAWDPEDKEAPIPRAPRMSDDDWQKSSAREAEVREQVRAGTAEKLSAAKAKIEALNPELDRVAAAARSAQEAITGDVQKFEAAAASEIIAKTQGQPDTLEGREEVVKALVALGINEYDSSDPIVYELVSSPEVAQLAAEIMAHRMSRDLLDFSGKPSTDLQREFMEGEGVKALMKANEEWKNVSGELTSAQNEFRSLGSDKARAESLVAEKLGPEHFAEKAYRDEKFYKDSVEEIAGKWAHIGGEPPQVMRFAAMLGLGLTIEEGQAFDSKLGKGLRNLEDLRREYGDSAVADAVRLSGAIRREYDETQEEIAEGFTFKVAGEGGDGGEVDEDALSEMQAEAYSNLTASDKADYVNDNDIGPDYIAENRDEILILAEDADEDLPTLGKYARASDVLESKTDEERAAVLDAMKKLNGTPAPPRESMGIAEVAERFRQLSEGAALNGGSRVREWAPKAGEGKLRSVTEQIAERFGASEEEVKSLESLISTPSEWAEKASEILKDREDSFKRASDILTPAGDDYSAFDNLISDQARENYNTDLDEILFKYAKWHYAEADPDGSVYDSWSSDWQPDETPMIPGSDAEEITINPDDWPITMTRHVDLKGKSVDKYLDNFAESFGYTPQANFGSDVLQKEVIPEEVLVFQGAKNWEIDGDSFGSKENEFIILSEPPKWVREAKERHEAIGRKVKEEKKRIEDEASERERKRISDMVEAKRDALSPIMARYTSLIGAPPAKNEEARAERRAQIDALKSQVEGSGIDWEDFRQAFLQHRDSFD